MGSHKKRSCFFAETPIVHSYTLEDFYIVDENSSGTVQGIAYKAQTFTAKNNYTIKRIAVTLTRTGLPGTVFFAIQNTAVGGEPDNIDLCVASINGNLLYDAIPGMLYYLDFTSPAPLTKDALYAIVARAPTGNKLNNLSWWCREPDGGYVDGMEWVTTDGGVIWTSVPVADYTFRTYS